MRKNFGIIFLILAASLLTIPGIAQKRKRAEVVPASSDSRAREAEYHFAEGEKHFILEDYAKALVFFERTLEFSPGNPVVNYKIAEVLSRSKQAVDLERAATHIEKALAGEKKNKYFYLLAAQIQGDLQNYPKAATYYEEMLRQVPGTEAYLTGLAFIYQRAEKPDAAILTYERAEKFFGLSPEFSIDKIRLLLAQSRQSQALSAANQLLKAYPDDEETALEILDAFLQEGHPDEARNLAEEFLKANPESTRVMQLLAITYRQLGNETRARELLIHVFERPAEDPSGKMIVLGTYNAEINLARSKGQPDSEKEKFALNLLSLLEKSGDTEQMAQILGGDLHLSMGNQEEATRYYKAAVEGDPVNVEVWENLLWLEHKLGRIGELVKHGERAIEYYPNQATLYSHLAFGQLRQKKYEDLLATCQTLKRLVRAEPEKLSEISWYQGEAHYALGAKQEADKAFEQALTYQPDNKQVLNNYAYYLALDKRNLERAIQLAENLMKLDDHTPAYLDTYGWVLFQSGKFREAVRVLQKVEATGKASATSLEHLGDALFKSGAVEEAVQKWQKASAMNPGNSLLIRKIQNKTLYE